MNNRIKINEAIVVEGRDDTDAVGKAAEAFIIETHGFGITAETWEILEKADREKGLLILTDPDFSGEEIRRKLSLRFPNAKHAYIEQSKATKADDIGVENASPEVIAEALLKAKATTCTGDPEITMSDMIRLGLSGSCEASSRRERIGAYLGIGYGNCKGLLKKLNGFGITLAELEEAAERTEN